MAHLFLGRIANNDMPLALRLFLGKIVPHLFSAGQHYHAVTSP